MKQILILLHLFFCTMMYSQVYHSDAEFNNLSYAAYINDTFVKNFVGFKMNREDCYKYDIKRIKLPQPININDITYNEKIIVETDKPFEFISLDDIRNQYFPDVSGKVIYMINNNFIINDEKSYKLDKDFFDRCEILHSSDFGLIEDNKDIFSIIRIFTKDWKIPIRIRRPEHLR